MMMKQQHHSQQQQQHSMNGVHGGPSPTMETKWWYKGPDGETYGPYTPREMSTWGNSGYFNDTLPVKTEKDDCFHSIGDWTAVMGGANPFGSGSVPAFNQLMHGAHAQQFLQYPPGLPAPFGSGVAPPSGRGGPDGRGFQSQGGPQPFVPNGGPPPPPPTAAMAGLHMGGGGGGGHMGMLHMHHGGPLSQPPSEPNDGANSSNSHTPDSAEPDFRAIHQMGGGMPPPPVPTMHAGRMQFGYGMPPMQQQHQAAAMAQHQQSLAAAAAAAAAAQQQAATHTSNGQLQYSRLTTTQDAPWNSRRDIAIDASQRAAPRSTIATQTLPVIIGSKDASRLLSELTGCQIVIT